MFAINLNPWGGSQDGWDFTYKAGDLIDLPDEMAKARIAAGHMREPTDAELAQEAQRHPGWAGTPRPEPTAAAPESSGKATRAKTT